MKRRDFMKMMGIGAGALGTMVVAGTAAGNNQPTAQVDAGHSSSNFSAPLPQERDWQAMNQHHEEGVKIFLDNIGKEENFWRNTPLEYTMDGDVKVFDITCSEINWDTGNGMTFPAMAYNGMVPGPTIRVSEGDKVRVNVKNEMLESTAVHFHGLIIPNNVDGVPYVTQQPINPGETGVLEFTIREGNIGSHMYHSHHNAAEQTTRGLLGAFIVDPKDTSREPQVDADYVLILNDSALGYTINGKGFPFTQPIVAKLGETIRVRYMNEGLLIHPMHLHGIPQQVIAKDGFYLPVPYLCDTLNIAPGERLDVLVKCTEPGLWAFHCHILTHAESRDGMFGMVTVLVVQE